jgi:hypothetical protein
VLGRLRNDPSDLLETEATKLPSTFACCLDRKHHIGGVVELFARPKGEAGGKLDKSRLSPSRSPILWSKPFLSTEKSFFWKRDCEDFSSLIKLFATKKRSTGPSSLHKMGEARASRFARASLRAQPFFPSLQRDSTKHFAAPTPKRLAQPIVRPKPTNG